MKRKLSQRNEIINALTDKNEDLSFRLELELTEAENSTTIVEREKYDMNFRAWSLVVTKITIEMLINGGPLSTVSENREF